MLEVKSEAGHGNYLSRLDAMGIQPRTAQDYIRLSDNSNTRGVAHLGIKAALQYLSAPEEVKALVDERIESGEDVTAAEIKRLKAELGEIARQKEEWRQQSISKKHVIDDLTQQLSDAEIREEAIRKFQPGSEIFCNTTYQVFHGVKRQKRQFYHGKYHS